MSEEGGMVKSPDRISTFVEWFIRSSWVEDQWNGLSVGEMYILDPDRAERCNTAAENGADGSTHREIINDWREAFRVMLASRRGWHQEPERFTRAVHAHFDAVEAWHHANGSLDDEIG